MQLYEQTNLYKVEFYSLIIIKYDWLNKIERPYTERLFGYLWKRSK